MVDLHPRERGQAANMHTMSVESSKGEDDVRAAPAVQSGCACARRARRPQLRACPAPAGWARWQCAGLQTLTLVPTLAHDAPRAPRPPLAHQKLHCSMGHAPALHHWALLARPRCRRRDQAPQAWPQPAVRVRCCMPGRARSCQPGHAASLLPGHTLWPGAVLRTLDAQGAPEAACRGAAHS